MSGVCFIRKLSEGDYKEGNSDGTWTYWDKNGQILGEKVWKDGKQVAGSLSF